VRGRRGARTAGCATVVVALIVAAPALGAFPGSNPDESVRLNTPNDPEFDRCEADNEGGATCANTFGQETERFGFAPSGSQNTALYKDLAALDPTNITRREQQNLAAGRNPLGQISGVSADRAWKYSTGRADVQVAILDTGIRWNNGSLRKKVALNEGELPAPRQAGGAECADDCNGDGAFDVDDYADDPRVVEGAGHDEADAILDASDLIAVFGQDGSDEDGNGYADDIAGWDFFDDDNDPYDASSYSSANNHGSGRAEEAGAQTDDSDGGTGVCPRCQVVPMRIWDTFVVPVGNFGQAVLYAADNEIEVVEGAVGGLENPRFARQVFDLAYRRGVFMTIVSSDLNSADHNFPTFYDEALQVQGTVADVQGLGTDPPDDAFVDFFEAFSIGTTAPIATWFRNSGTTQYGGHAHIAMPAVTGSQATGQASGAAALIASFGRQRAGAATEPLAGGPLDPNEIKQLLTMTAEDVLPENTTGTGTPDPAQVGWDQHFGYGRPDLGLALQRIREGRIPPQALLTSPSWFEPLNVERQDQVEIAARLSAKRAAGYSWDLQWAPGIEPAEDDFVDVAGEENETAARDGALGNIDLEAVRSALDARTTPCAPPSNSGTDPVVEGGGTCDPTAPGKGPNDTDPNEPAFTVRVVVTDDDGNRAEDRKTLFAYRDTTQHEGWSRKLGTGGEASQRMFDLNGDNALDIVEADSSGEMRVLNADGTPLASFNGGQPVQTRQAANVHPEAPGYDTVAPPREVLRTPAIGDIDGDRLPEIVNTAGEHVYAWEANGDEVEGFPQRLNPAFSLPADRTRTNHVKRGFLAPPTLGDLDDDASMEIVAPALDQHVYAFDGDGDDLPGFPKKLRVPAENLDGAEIINAAAVGNVTGDEEPEIVVPTAEFDDNPSAPNPPAGLGGFGNILTNVLANAAGGSGRVYALDASGNILPGWPTKPNGFVPDALPLVGPGVDHVLGNVDGDPELEAIGNLATGDVQATDGDGSPSVDYESQPTGGNELVDDGKMLNLFENAIVADLAPLEPGLEVLKGGVSLNGLVNIGVAVGQNLPFNHTLQAWNGQLGTYRPGFPQAVDDLQLLSSPAVADVSDAPGPEAVLGTGLYLLRNINANGLEGAGWPKFTGGWIYAVPAIGDVDGDDKLEVSVLTREGHSFLWDTDQPACGTNDEWWTSRHDEFSSGAYGTDSRPPGTPRALTAERTGDGARLSWTAPGDDWLCGQAERYEIRASDGPIDSPSDGQEVASGPADAATGDSEDATVALPAGTTRVAVLYRDDAGNWGGLASTGVPASDGSAGPGGDAGGDGGPTPGKGTAGNGTGDGATRKPCIPRRARVSANRIGPARIGASMRSLQGRHHVARRGRGTVRFCVRGGGRFLVRAAGGRINFVATTARLHRTRQVFPSRRLRSIRGARRVRRGLLVGRLQRRGRVVYGTRAGRVRFLAVVSRSQVRRPAVLARRLRVLGLR
jgi:Subtilase family